MPAPARQTLHRTPVLTVPAAPGARRLALGGIVLASYVAVAVLVIVGAEVSGVGAAAVVAVLAAYLGSSALIGGPWTYRLAIGPWILVGAWVAELDAHGLDCNCSGGVLVSLAVVAMAGFVSVIALGPLVALCRAVRRHRRSRDSLVC